MTDNNGTSREILTRKQAAEYAGGYHEETISRYVKAGKLKCVRAHGGQMLLTKDDLDAAFPGAMTLRQLHSSEPTPATQAKQNLAWMCNDGHSFVQVAEPSAMAVRNGVRLFCTRCGEVKELGK